MSFIEIKNKNESWATINWQVTDWCNYRCSYCNEFNWGGKHKNNDNIDVMLANLEQIINVFKKNNIHYFKLAITGGEPAVWKGLIPLVKKFREIVGYEGHTVSLNTNLSRNIEWWEENYKYFDKIIASFHSEFTDKDEYFKKYNFLQGKIEILARIMMHKDKFSECIDIANKIKKHCNNYHISYAPILSTLAPDVMDYQYIEESHMEFLKKHSVESVYNTFKPKKSKIVSTLISEDLDEHPLNLQKVVNNKQNSFFGWQCDIYKGIFISSAGDITLATCGQAASIGNIFTDTILDNFIKPVICKKDWCLCDTDINIPKRKLVVDKLEQRQ